MASGGVEITRGLVFGINLLHLLTGFVVATQVTLPTV
jgi:hypothetical protein